MEREEIQENGMKELTMCGAAWMPTDLLILMGATYSPFLAWCSAANRVVTLRKSSICQKEQN